MSKLAEDHVDWQLKLLRPLLISYFKHGYKHGRDEAKTPQDEQNGVVSANGGVKAYQGVGSGGVSTTEDIQRGWAENERKSKKRVYEDG